MEEDLEQSQDSIWEDEKFVKELEKRSKEIKSGKVKGITWEEVKRNLQSPMTYDIIFHPLAEMDLIKCFQLVRGTKRWPRKIIL